MWCRRGFALVALAIATGCGGDESPFDAPACAAVVTSGRIAVAGVDRYDVLFVVDDSPSMVEEQGALQRELPRLVQRLLDGGADDGGGREWPIDAHVGVISADLGAEGVEGGPPGCSASGDAGRLQHAARGDGCEAEYPAFLSFASRPPLLELPSPASTEGVVSDFACIAPLGTEGCGFAQPLASAIRALAPAEPAGASEGEAFLRNDPRDGLSLVLVVIVTDQDDCSLEDPGLLADPAAGASPAVRCAASSRALASVAGYVDRLRALRPGNEQLVMLSVITGVPPERVATVPEDFSDNPATQARFYDALLSDPRMQQVPRADGTLTPVCESDEASATPAPRLVEAVRALGANGSVVSICQSDWAEAIDRVIRLTARRIGIVCPRRRIARAADGLVPCEVVWELPGPERAVSSAPTRCEQAPSLLARDEHRPVGEQGGERCVVRQLAVRGAPEARQVEPGFGWFFDDFSEEVQRECTTTPKQRFAFSSGAEPPSGVEVSYECFETGPLAPADGDLEDGEDVPEPFDACDPESELACARLLRERADDPGYRLDLNLVCHPEHAACVVPCVDGACPVGWSCNDDPAPYCEPGECRVPG